MESYHMSSFMLVFFPLNIMFSSFIHVTEYSRTSFCGQILFHCVDVASLIPVIIIAE